MEATTTTTTQSCCGTNQCCSDKTEQSTCCTTTNPTGQCSCPGCPGGANCCTTTKTSTKPDPCSGGACAFNMNCDCGSELCVECKPSTVKTV
eukprot:403362318